MPATDSGETKTSTFHVFAAGADVPDSLTYCTSVNIDGETFHLLMELGL